MIVAEEEKKRFWQCVKEPGSVWQIIFAALLAIAIGLIVSTQVEEVHPAAIAVVAIPGTLWLRALRAVGMFICVFVLVLKADLSSAPHNCHCYDYGDPTSSCHDPRRWKGWQARSMDD